jgi:hypothetical protein
MKRHFAVALVVFGLLAGSIGTAAAMPVGSPTMSAAQLVAARVRTCISVFVPFNPKKRLSGEFAFGGISVTTNPQRNLFIRVNRSRGTPHLYTVEITNPQGVDVANNCGTPSVISMAPMLAPDIAVNLGTGQVIGYVNKSNNYDFTVTITCDLP